MSAILLRKEFTPVPAGKAEAGSAERKEEKEWHGRNITILFSSEQAAYEYAVKYESGTVEVQKDGSYRYTGSFFVNRF